MKTTHNHRSVGRFSTLHFSSKVRIILGQAVTVGVTMFVLSISELSEVGMVSTI